MREDGREVQWSEPRMRPSQTNRLRRILALAEDGFEDSPKDWLKQDEGWETLLDDHRYETLFVEAHPDEFGDGIPGEFALVLALIKMRIVGEERLFDERLNALGATVTTMDSARIRLAISVVKDRLFEHAKIEKQYKMAEKYLEMVRYWLPELHTYLASRPGDLYLDPKVVLPTPDSVECSNNIFEDCRQLILAPGIADVMRDVIASTERNRRPLMPFQTSDTVHLPDSRRPPWRGFQN